MRNLIEAPRLALALEQWRDLLLSDAGGADILSPLVNRLADAQPGILAYIFFGCHEDGAPRFAFMGTEAAETLKVDSRHGARPIGPRLGALDSIIAATDRRRGAAFIRAQVKQIEYAILILPTGPDASGAPGFLGVYEEGPPVSPDRRFILEYLEAPADAAREGDNITPLRDAG